MQQLQIADATIHQLAPHIERYGKMEQLLTDANLLAAYVNDYFTNVVPVRSTAEQLAVQEQQLRQQNAFPGMPVPSGNQDINLADIRPDQRWKVADKMEEAGLFRGKVLVIE